MVEENFMLKVVETARIVLCVGAGTPVFHTSFILYAANYTIIYSK